MRDKFIFFFQYQHLESCAIIVIINKLTCFMPRCVDRLLVASVLFKHQNETRLFDFVLVSNRSSRKRDRFTVRPSDYISDSVTAPSSTATVPKR